MKQSPPADAEANPMASPPPRPKREVKGRRGGAGSWTWRLGGEYFARRTVNDLSFTDLCGLKPETYVMLISR
ncbi:hypothetical protein ACP4OV_019794 [Aristida adscensionis]